jgi:hypothetical protein
VPRCRRPAARVPGPYTLCADRDTDAWRQETLGTAHTQGNEQIAEDPIGAGLGLSHALETDHEHRELVVIHARHEIDAPAGGVGQPMAHGGLEPARHRLDQRIVTGRIGRARIGRHAGTHYRQGEKESRLPLGLFDHLPEVIQ